MWFPKLKANDEDTGLLGTHLNLSKDLIIGWQGLRKNPNTGKNDKKTYKYRAFENHMEFWNFYNQQSKNQKTFNEVVLGARKQKLRFDLDLEGVTDRQIGRKLFTDILEATIEFFKVLGYPLDLKRDIIVFTSHGSEKLSYHVIIDNYCFGNSDIVKYVAQQITEPFVNEISNKWIDFGIYDKNHPFRIYGNYKAGSDRIKSWNQTYKYGGKTYVTKLDLGDPDPDLDQDLIEDYAILQASLITCTDHCTLIPISLPEREYPDVELEDEHIQYAMELLSNMEDGDAFELLNVEGNFINLKRLRPTNCYCGGYHESQNPYIFFTGENILFGCRRSKSKLNLGTLQISETEEKPAI